MNIIKRNGKEVKFDKDKIISAINKAFIEVDGQLYETDTATDIAEDIESYFIAHPYANPTVETIQNMVEEYLMSSERKDVARAYVRFRYKEEIARLRKDDILQAILKKLSGNDVDNQNANVDGHSFGGRTGEASGILTKQLALDHLISERTRDNHIKNRIYIHDLDNYFVGSHNCLSIPFDHLLAKGFNTRQTDIRPASSVNTAFQLIAVIFQLQSLQQFGRLNTAC